MKILVSTKDMQGKRNNDFCFVPENEIVIYPFFECGNESVDGQCGCRRSLCGIKSMTGTTTFKVVDMDISKTEFVKLYKKSMIKAGFGKVFKGRDKGLKIEMEKKLDDMATELTMIAKMYDLGTVLERRESSLFCTRRQNKSAEKSVEIVFEK